MSPDAIATVLTAVGIPIGVRRMVESVRRDLLVPGSAAANCEDAGVATIDDFRRLALGLDGAEESSHMGSPDFRVGGRIFATLAHQTKGYGNLMLTPEVQAGFVAEAPAIFVPVAGGWGRNGATHIRLEAADEETLAGALRTAWTLRVEKNAQARRRRRQPVN